MSESKHYIFYHSADLDGHCSGEITRRYFESMNLSYELVGINYGEPFDMNRFTDQDTVYFVDWTLQPRELNFELANKTNLIIIDHHKTSLGLTDKCTRIHGLIDTSLAACELVWKWFYPNSEVPRFINLLGIYDSWRKTEPNWDTEALPFQWGMRTYETRPGEAIWNELFAGVEHAVPLIRDQLRIVGDIGSIISKGKLILDYQKRVDAIAMRNSFVFDFEGYKVLAVIGGGGNSQTFESTWDHYKHDIMMSISNHKNQYWKISMYTDKPGMDISGIAKKWGGGGHAQACGFEVEDIYKVIPSTRKPNE